MRITLFGKSAAIEADIDNFLDRLSEAGLLFERTIKHYVENGANEEFQEGVSRLEELHASTDELGTGIGRSLYTEMLIPDLRADVLSLIQDLNYLVGAYSDVATSFDIERPEHSQAPAEGKRMYGDLVELTVKSVEMTVVSARAFFRDINAVNDHVHKVGFYEAEVDSVSQKLKRHVFAQDFPLDLKMQYRYFIDVLEQLADDAKDASEWIAIYAIKRTL